MILILPIDLTDFHNYEKLIGHTLVALTIWPVYAVNTSLNFNDAMYYM